MNNHLNSATGEVHSFFFWTNQEDTTLPVIHNAYAMHEV